MKHALLLLLVVLVSLTAAGCVTSGDLRTVADSVASLEGTLQDETASPEEVQAAIVKAKDEIAAVAHGAEERTKGFADALTGSEGGVALLISTLTAAGLSVYRNSTRKKALQTASGA